MSRHQPERLAAKLKELDVKSPSHPAELRWLWDNAFDAANIFRKCTILELGTLKGVSALYMADGVLEAMEAKPGYEIKTKVVTVDNYQDFNEGRFGHSHADNVALVKELGYADLIDVVECDDEAFLAAVPERSLGMIFIDSWHVYEKVSALLQMVIPKMKSGALISGHDYCFGERGVVWAVDEFLANNAGKLSGFTTFYRNWWTLIKRGG